MMKKWTPHFQLKFVKRMMIADGLMEQNLAIFLTTAEDRSACHIQKESESILDY